MKNYRPLARIFMIGLAAALLLLSAPGLLAAKKPKSKPAAKPAAAVAPDVLVFSNGDKLTGKLTKADGAKVTFSAQDAGNITVPWSKIKELQTAQPFAVIAKNQDATRKRQNSAIPIGELSYDGKVLTVTENGQARVVPLTQVSNVIDSATFHKNVDQRQGLLQGITGALTFGYAQVNSTFNTKTINSGVNLSRTVPAVPWMKPAFRTLLNFTNSYSTFKQSPNPTAVTNILHGSLEEDEFLEPRFYALEQAIYDKNSVEGLDLQQIYGGGFGYTLIKRPKQSLDVSGTINYTQQQFATPITLVAGQAPHATQHLVGATFADNYMYKLPRNIILMENANINPQFNYAQAYTANATVGATMPIIKTFALTVQAIDNYLNDPPPGFKRNSTQYTTGLTYTLP